jgi:hypothetical protein
LRKLCSNPGLPKTRSIARIEQYAMYTISEKEEFNPLKISNPQESQKTILNKRKYSSSMKDLARQEEEEEEEEN